MPSLTSEHKRPAEPPLRADSDPQTQNNPIDKIKRTVKLQLRKMEDKIPNKYKEHFNRYEKAIASEFNKIRLNLRKDSRGRRPLVHYVLALLFFYFVFVR